MIHVIYIRFKTTPKTEQGFPRESPHHHMVHVHYDFKCLTIIINKLAMNPNNEPTQQGMGHAYTRTHPLTPTHAHY